jgi:PAS domain S-box-containing protein
VLAGPDGSRLLVLYPPAFFSRPGDAIDALGAPGELAEIFHNSYDGIFVTDGQGVALWLNEGCERNYGVRAQDVIGRNVCELEDAGVISPVIAPRVIATKKRITAMQTTRSGKKVVVTGIPLFDDYGNVRRVILNSRDTTELVRLQEQLAQAHEKLEKFESEIEHLRQETADMIDGIVVQSPRMRAVVELAVRVAKVDTTVLVHGESGVGKEIIGRLIHRSSARCTGPLIKVNCGAIPRELIESELFGYEGGAFTSARRQGKIGMFELAHNGTLFLDEIGELPLDMQAKLLQVLQDRTITRVGGTKPIPVDFRVVAATNRLLGDMVNQKLFRKDLYFRLNVVSVLVPPLRERVEDIVPLIRHFLDEFNRQYGISRQLSESALAELLRYRWPGNVRELRNVIERLVVTTVGDVIEQVDLIDPFDAASGDDPAEAEPGDLKLRVARYEERLLREALKKHGSTRAVAKALDISQSSVVRKLKG